MTRVLISTDAVGGVWRYSLELAQGLSRHGCETVLAVLGPPPDAAQREAAQTVPNLRLVVTGQALDWTADSPDALNQAATCLAQLAVHEDADTVQLHAPALVGSAIWPVPLIVTVHSCVATWWRAVHGGCLPPDLAWRAAAAADGLAAADAVITPSASFAADLRACYGLSRCIHVIPNGRQPFPGRGTRRPVVLTAARLWDEGKGVSTLDAAARLIPHPVYAAGPQIAPHGAVVTYPYLNLLGSLDEASLANWYAKSAVFTSVSRYEPFGLAVLEAAQAGCALVLSDIATFRELWDGAAVFVPVDDPVALAGALRRVLSDEVEADQLGGLAQARAARFDPHRMVASTWKVHAAMLAREAI